MPMRSSRRAHGVMLRCGSAWSMRGSPTKRCATSRGSSASNVARKATATAPRSTGKWTRTDHDYRKRRSLLSPCARGGVIWRWISYDNFMKSLESFARHRRARQRDSRGRSHGSAVRVGVQTTDGIYFSVLTFLERVPTCERWHCGSSVIWSQRQNENAHAPASAQTVLVYVHGSAAIGATDDRLRGAINGLGNSLPAGALNLVR